MTTGDVELEGAEVKKGQRVNVMFGVLAGRVEKLGVVAEPKRRINTALCGLESLVISTF